MNLTRSQFERLPRHEQTRVYFSHPSNLGTGKNNSRGPTAWAQRNFDNNWRNAFERFADLLEHH